MMLSVEVEKVKRNHELQSRNHTKALLMIIFILSLLTIMSSYSTLGVLFDPRFFYPASLIIGVSLIPIGIASLTRGFLQGLIIILSVLMLGLVTFLYFETVFTTVILISFFMAIPNAIIQMLVPSFMFPISLSIIVVITLLVRLGRIRLPKLPLDSIAALLYLFAIVYIWGQGYSLRQWEYDEALKIGGKTYHTIMVYGYLGDPGAVFLFECQIGHFFCAIQYQSSSGYYYPDKISLIYNEAERILQLHNSGEILYEYSIP